MGLFSGLFGGGNKAIDESKYNILLSFSKVGLAFLSGSDGGSLSLISNGNSIQYILLCRSTFFVYQDELGIGVETLLKNQGGNCPLELWNAFVNTVDIRKISKRTDGEQLDIRTAMPIEKGTSKLYFDKLAQSLVATYPGLRLENKGDSLSIIVPGSDTGKFSYR